MPIHLTCHAIYSLQEGLTGHNLLKGSIEFVTACSDAGIQPILGLEIDFEGSPLQLPTHEDLQGTVERVVPIKN